MTCVDEEPRNITLSAILCQPTLLLHLEERAARMSILQLALDCQLDAELKVKMCAIVMLMPIAAPILQSLEHPRKLPTMEISDSAEEVRLEKKFLDRTDFYAQN